MNPGSKPDENSGPTRSISSSQELARQVSSIVGRPFIAQLPDPAQWIGSDTKASIQLARYLERMFYADSVGRLIPGAGANHVLKSLTDDVSKSEQEYIRAKGWTESEAIRHRMEVFETAVLPVVRMHSDVIKFKDVDKKDFLLLGISSLYSASRPRSSENHSLAELNSALERSHYGQDASFRPLGMDWMNDLWRDRLREYESRGIANSDDILSSSAAMTGVLLKRIEDVLRIVKSHRDSRHVYPFTLYQLPSILDGLAQEIRTCVALYNMRWYTKGSFLKKWEDTQVYAYFLHCQFKRKWDDLAGLTQTEDAAVVSFLRAAGVADQDDTETNLGTLRNQAAKTAKAIREYVVSNSQMTEGPLTSTAHSLTELASLAVPVVKWGQQIQEGSR